MLWELKYKYLQERNYEAFTYIVVHGVFTVHKSYRFDGVEGLESYFLMITLMKDEYLLHNINEKQISLALH
jgi:hypothetical protein